MAVRALTRGFLGAQFALITWPGLTNGDTGRPLELPEYGDRTVSFEGTFGVDGSVTLEGSDDGRSYHPLTDPRGHAITKTAAATEGVTETPRYTRPHVTAGDRSTVIHCRIVARRGAR
jgi:hypothetical protein